VLRPAGCYAPHCLPHKMGKLRFTSGARKGCEYKVVKTLAPSNPRHSNVSQTGLAHEQRSAGRGG
jgi:hypothetical protein